MVWLKSAIQKTALGISLTTATCYTPAGDQAEISGASGFIGDPSLLHTSTTLNGLPGGEHAGATTGGTEMSSMSGAKTSSASSVDPVTGDSSGWMTSAESSVSGEVTTDGADDGGLPICGDQQIGLGEDCDGINLGQASCFSLGLGSGALSCSADCAFDTSGCNLCGNGRIDGDERCDGFSFDDADDCEDVGLGSADERLRCTLDCRLDFLECGGCGDGVVASPEDCEPASGDVVDPDLGGKTCHDLGWDGGTLDCDADCRFVERNCHRCGDGIVAAGEACELDDFAGMSCRDYLSLAGPNFDRGQLLCTSDCHIDTSSCSYCGDHVISGDERCDGDNVGGKSCADVGPFTGGELGCAGHCMDFDDSACTKCGDGRIEGEELCDTQQLGGENCLSRGFEGGGKLACTPDCRFDESNCDTKETCGNGLVGASETCDCGEPSQPCTAEHLSFRTCTDLPAPGKPGIYFSGGVLACRSPVDCSAYDLSGCWFCGDGEKNNGEHCDDGNDDDFDGCTRTCLPSCSADSHCNDGRSCTTDRCVDDVCVHEEVDNDGDGYSICNSHDCCDSDPKAHPGQTAYFATANACGDYDWNCSGAEERRYESWNSCKFMSSGFCALHVEPVPECGESQVHASLCEFDGENRRCPHKSATRTQSCR